MSIPFTQFLMPDGRQKTVSMEQPEAVEKQAHEIIEKGFEFQIEMLTTGEISMTIFDPRTEEDVAIEVCDNGPDVPVSIRKMIGNF